MMRMQYWMFLHLALTVFAGAAGLRCWGTNAACSWGKDAACREWRQEIPEIPWPTHHLRGGRQGNFQTNAAMPSSILGSAFAQDDIRLSDVKSRAVYQLQLDACQRAMDLSFESRIRPQLDGLEQKIVDGSTDDSRSSYKPFKHFAVDTCKILSTAKSIIEAAVQNLQVELEVIQYVGLGDGNPVSTVDFERIPVDFTLVRRMVSETKRELMSATERTIDGLWIQHKALVEEHYFEEFERGFDGLIGGSKQFNATARKLSKRLFKECEKVFKNSVPPQKLGQWEYSSNLDNLQQRILASVEARRRLSGLDDLMKYFKDESPKIFSVRWFKNILIRGAVTYFQVLQCHMKLRDENEAPDQEIQIYNHIFCQSAWAYRKARGIPYPKLLTRQWFQAVLVPWRLNPSAQGPQHNPAPPPATGTTNADGIKVAPQGEDGTSALLRPGRLGTVPSE